ncbi:unnamed protein product, partial [Urochloa humidicola]
VVGASRRPRAAGGVLVEAYGAHVVRPWRAAVRRQPQTDGVAEGFAAVREPLLLEAADPPLEVAQQDGCEALRDGQDLGDPGRVRLLPRADVVLGENDVPRLLLVARRVVVFLRFLLASVFVIVVQIS